MRISLAIYASVRLCVFLPACVTPFRSSHKTVVVLVLRFTLYFTCISAILTLFRANYIWNSWTNRKAYVYDLFFTRVRNGPQERNVAYEILIIEALCWNQLCEPNIFVYERNIRSNLWVELFVDLVTSRHLVTTSYELVYLICSVLPAAFPDQEVKPALHFLFASDKNGSRKYEITSFHTDLFTVSSSFTRSLTSS